MAFLSLLAPFAGPLIEWLARRRVIKAARAANMLAWWNSQGERHAWPAERRERLRDARARIIAREAARLHKAP